MTHNNVIQERILNKYWKEIAAKETDENETRKDTKQGCRQDKAASTTRQKKAGDTTRQQSK